MKNDRFDYISYGGFYMQSPIHFSDGGGGGGGGLNNNPIPLNCNDDLNKIHMSHSSYLINDTFMTNNYRVAIF